MANRLNFEPMMARAEAQGAEAVRSAERQGPDKVLELAAGICDLEARIDALLRVPFRHLRPPPDIHSFYVTATRPTARRINHPWCLWVGAMVLLNGVFDIPLLSAGMLPAALMFRIAIAAGFVLASWLLRQDWTIGYEHIAVISPCLFAIVGAGTVGLISGDDMLTCRYMNEAIIVSYTAVMIVRIDFEHCVSLGTVATLLTALFVALSNVHPDTAKLQIVVFDACVMAGLLRGRHVQNLLLFRLFLLSTRDKIRNSEVSRRNERLSSFAYHDKLTGIPNRRYFDDICATISDAGQSRLPLSLCMIDIDHFKKLNDTLGHPQGDRCLALVAATIRDNLRERADFLVRYGGEEFALLLPQTDLAQAIEIAERVRVAIAALAYENPGAPFAIVTVSIGVATLTSLPLAIDALIEDADSALYRAKFNGRDQVCF